MNIPAKTKKAISKKISELRKEGIPMDQAIAKGYAMVAGGKYAKKK